MRRTSSLLVAGFLLLGQTVLAQRPATAPSKAPETGNPPVVAPKTTGPKPYKEVITAKAKTEKGLLITHTLDDKYFFEIPDAILNREILVVNRISKAAAAGDLGRSGYAGDQIGENVIVFEKGPNNKIFLKSISYQENSKDSSGGMYQSVRNSSLQPIAASFDVKALAKDSVTGVTGSVIEVTDFLMGDNDIFFFDAGYKRSLQLTQYQKDNSYISKVKSYPTNTLIQTVKTYLRTQAPSPGSPSAAPGAGSPTTYELSSSMILLPATPMKARYFDARVGYFATGYTDYDLNPQGIQQVRMITRWKLEPKEEDIEKYKRGELVEPKKPIVFIIDPATPKKWLPYLIKGVNDWQIAFEKAGFSNAIIAKEAPANDPEWSLENANYSAIVYKPSDIPNASGPHVHDPRSGEILESHINWYHNVMSLLRNWYLIQTAAVDPAARKLVFEDELMGELIRFVSSHEVGHTLGLRHNFGSSSTVPVENLRNKNWVEANGHTPSIMDYARFNYVAQPEDNIAQKGLFPRIGDYDKWAIEWGYRWYPELTSPEAELPMLNKMTIEKLKDKRLWFGTESDGDDPRAQNEDLGDNAMIAGAYGVKNLQRILVKLPEWTKENNKGYSSLNELYGQVVTQFQRYIGHVSKNIGGIMTTPKTVEQEGVVVEFVNKAKQKEAMAFLQNQLFVTPIWLVDNNIVALTGYNKISTIGNIQSAAIDRLLSNPTLDKLIRAQEQNAAAYSINEMLTDLRKGIYSELAGHKAMDVYRRNLQKVYAERLISNMSDAGNVPAAAGGRGGASSANYPKNSDAKSVVRMQLKILSTEIKAALPLYTDMLSKAHLEDVLYRINDSLNPKN
ncbi:MAG: zinc-dependent metalloprotease [Ferruginibacter sp.]